MAPLGDSHRSKEVPKTIFDWWPRLLHNFGLNGFLCGYMASKSADLSADNSAHTNEPGRRVGDMVVIAHGGVDAFGEKPPYHLFPGDGHQGSRI